MPKKQSVLAAQAVETAALDSAGVEVRALCDYEPLGLVAGALGRVPLSVLPQLKARAMVDDHPDAVAFARHMAGTSRLS